MSSTEPVMISQEMMYLFGSVVILLVVLFVQSVTTVLANGLRWGLGPRDVPAKDDLFAGRAKRTVQNHMEGLALFGFAILIIEMSGLNSDLSKTGAALFFWARLDPRRPDEERREIGDFHLQRRGRHGNVGGNDDGGRDRFVEHRCDKATLDGAGRIGEALIGHEIDDDTLLVLVHLDKVHAKRIRTGRTLL